MMVFGIAQAKESIQDLRWHAGYPASELTRYLPVGMGKHYTHLNIGETSEHYLNKPGWHTYRLLIRRDL